MELDKELFNLLTKEKLNITDLANIRDYYMWKVLDILKSDDKEKAKEYMLQLEHFSSLCFDDFYRGFFFALSQMVALKHEIGTIEGDLIKRKEFEKSFKETIKRWFKK